MWEFKVLILSLFPILNQSLWGWGQAVRSYLCSCICVYTWNEYRGQRHSLVSFFKHCLPFPWCLLLVWGLPKEMRLSINTMDPPLSNSRVLKLLPSHHVQLSWVLVIELRAWFLPSKSQVQMILMNKKFKKNDSKVCFFFLYQGLHFEEMMVMHPVNIFPSMPCSKGDQWCSCGSNWEGPPGEQVWKSPVQLGELDQKERQHHTRPCCMVPAP